MTRDELGQVAREAALIIDLSGHDFILGMLVGAACVWISLLTRTAHQRYEAMRAEHRAQVARVRAKMGREDR